ncbi:tyrosine-type recombinase/integrase [Magnetovibrio sp. PR-2]|uniref:tyrosine-type recombinase/integrase n=1 Tax=Magnetovibrio sp. PR-2 TaxID=3120356 RepID=UPI002FCDF63B
MAKIDWIVEGQFGLRKHPNTKNLQIIYKRPGMKQYSTKTAGTADRNEAKLKAIEFWAQAPIKEELGVRVNGITFKTIAEQWIKELPSLVKRGLRGATTAIDYPPVVNRYLVPSLGKYQIDAITDTHIENYWTWRDEYWSEHAIEQVDYFYRSVKTKTEICTDNNNLTHARIRDAEGNDIKYVVTVPDKGKKTVRAIKSLPSQGALKRDAMVLGMIFEYARKKGYTTRDRIPGITVPKRLDSKRNKSRLSFSWDQMDAIISKLALYDAQYFMRLNETPGMPTDDMRLLHAKRTLSVLIKMVYFTGIVPGKEAFNLKWKHVRATTKDAWGHKQQVIQVAVGGGKNEYRVREVIPKLKLWKILERWEGESKYTEDEDYIFSNLKGKQIQSMDKSFRTLMEELRGENSKDHRWNDKFVLYSFRHTYCTHSLQMGENIRSVASNMGHSDTKMVEKWYGHDKPVDYAAQLEKDWDSKL